MYTEAAHLKDPALEVLLFTVGGEQYGVPLGQVVGLVRDLSPGLEEASDDGRILLFEGVDVPVFPARDYLHATAPRSRPAREAIIFNDGEGLYGMAIDGTDAVVDITPGDELYILPPEPPTDACPFRVWAVLTVGERPVIMLDMSRVAVH
jgi:chemotaxis signal transduction protein